MRLVVRWFENRATQRWIAAILVLMFVLGWAFDYGVFRTLFPLAFLSFALARLLAGIVQVQAGEDEEVSDSRGDDSDE